MPQREEGADARLISACPNVAGARGEAPATRPNAASPNTAASSTASPTRKAPAARPRLAVSACLLGEACRFDGAAKPCAAVRALAERFELVPVCPEVAGGLPTPRTPCEIVARTPDLHVRDKNGIDRTAAYRTGAAATLAAVRAAGCTAAVLKEKSPSCGVERVYDGTFSGREVAGCGVTTAFLRAHGIPVVSEHGVSTLTT